MPRLIFIMFFMVMALHCGAQTKIIDSLKKRIYTATSDTEKLRAILSVCEEYRSLHRDTLLTYARTAKELALAQNDKRDIVLADLALANMYYRWGWTDSALAIVDPMIRQHPVSNQEMRDLHFKMARQKALYHGGKSQYPQALAVLYQLVSDAEKYRDTITIGSNLNTIGSVALARDAPRVALGWFRRALGYSTHDRRYMPVIGAIYVNMGDAYNLLGKSDSAEYFIGKGINLLRESQNLLNLGHALQRQSKIYMASRQVEKAEASLREMIEVRRLTNDGTMWIDDNISLVDFYLETGQVEKAIAFCKDAIKTGNLYDTTEIKGTAFVNNINLRLNYYEALARCYKVAGDQAGYQETLENIINAKDSFYLANSELAIAEVQTKYEVQKKENTIIQQQLGLARKNTLIYLSLGGLLFAAIVAALLFTSYKKREKLKMQLMMEKQKDMASKAIAQAEESERKRIAADLHDNLGAYAASIASNLDFIRAGSKESQGVAAMQELHNNSQAMVAQLGDTIWALNKEELTLTAISDRLKEFIRRIRPSYPQVEIEVEESINVDKSLSPAQAFHLFRIIQEAVVNSLKHGQGSQVRVAITDGDDWSITVTDNGRGMEGAVFHENDGGNGLGNMKKRAMISGWDISWSRGETGGTIVRVGSAA